MKKNGINFTSLTQLDTFGLIRFDYIGGYQQTILPRQFRIMYFGSPITIALKENISCLQTGNVILTQAGQQLVSICGAVPNDELKDVAVNMWKKDGITIHKGL